MIEEITSGVSGIISALGSLLAPTLSDATNAQGVAWVALLALPVLGGSIAMARRLIKKTSK